jgi:hypothetical protein
VHCATAVNCYSRQTVPLSTVAGGTVSVIRDSAVATAPNTHLKPEAAKAFLSQYYQRRILQYEFHIYTNTLAIVHREDYCRLGYGVR